MALWAVAGLILLLFRDERAARGRADWLWICPAGCLLGVPGRLVTRQHDANRRRRRGGQPGAPR